MKENSKRSDFDPRSHIGEEHGIYKIVDMLEEKDKYGHYIYVAECKECGYKKYTHYGEISGEVSKATVCRHLASDGRYIQQNKWNNHRIQGIFSDMKYRCYNERNKDYSNYGAKGVRICDEWLDNPKSFEEWSLQNGYEDSLTIDRKDPNLNYSPDNCRWVTLEDNARYKTTTSLIDIDGEVHTGRDWSKILGFGVNMINKYIRKYGLENTIVFIKKFISEPKRNRKSNESYYELYMDV